MRVTGISWLGVGVDDLSPTLEFFRDAMGIELIGEYDDGSAKLRVAERQILEIFGPRSDGRELTRTPALGFEVTDIEGARKELEERGVGLIGDLGSKHGFRWQFFREPGGNVFALKTTPDVVV